MRWLHLHARLGTLAIVILYGGSNAVAETPAVVARESNTQNEAADIETLKQRVRELEHKLAFSKHLALLASPRDGDYVPFITWVKIDKTNGCFHMAASFPKPGDPISLPLPWTTFQVEGRTFIVFPADLEGSAHAQVSDQPFTQTGPSIPVTKQAAGTKKTEPLIEPKPTAQSN
ncbi:MAG: hypothetical protein H6822_00030 [Planctomycetaceae bacterium]|nr:hypothetical protein [Planctomycetaceae bacterium]